MTSIGITQLFGVAHRLLAICNCPYFTLVSYHNIVQRTNLYIPGKQCILTITRLNGHSRSYKTEPEFKRKIDAKSRVADIAVEMGAIDFILYGNKKTDKSLVLAPVDEEYEKHLAERIKQLDAQSEHVQPGEVKIDVMSQTILDHCAEWRAGRVTPRWISYIDMKSRSEYIYYIDYRSWD
jgi:hypothetical protein